MDNLSAIQDHIEASAPCSLFSVAVWAEEQLTINVVEFTAIINTLASADTISISMDDHGLVIDLI